MTTINIEIYQALKEAGASEEKAQAAAEAVNSEGGRLDRIETNIARMETNISWLRWITIGGFTIMFSILGKGFSWW